MSLRHEADRPTFAARIRLEPCSRRVAASAAGGCPAGRIVRQDMRRESSAPELGEDGRAACARRAHARHGRPKPERGQPPARPMKTWARWAIAMPGADWEEHNETPVGEDIGDARSVGIRIPWLRNWPYGQPTGRRLRAPAR